MKIYGSTYFEFIKCSYNNNASKTLKKISRDFNTCNKICRFSFIILWFYGRISYVKLNLEEDRSRAIPLVKVYTCMFQLLQVLFR